MIELVRSLVQSRIRGGNTLILITIPISGMKNLSIIAVHAQQARNQTTWRINRRFGSLGKLILVENAPLVRPQS
jgi:hypothetical protein